MPCAVVHKGAAIEWRLQYLRLQSIKKVRVDSHIPSQEMFKPIRGLYRLQEKGSKCDVISYVQPGAVKFNLSGQFELCNDDIFDDNHDHVL